MATGVKSWSTTAANNASADSTINWAEGMAPSLVNDSARAEMAAIAAWYAQIAGGTVSTGTVGGTANAITLTCSPTVDALATSQRYLFKYTSTGTTGAVTLQVDSTSAIALRYKDVALTSGDIATGDWVFCLYDGTRYQMINHPRVSWATTDMATDSTGGATGDFIPFLDASASNELNKVLTTDLMANMIANFTTKTAPTVSDKIMIGDAAASGAAKISTVQQLADAHNGLTQKSTPTTSDRVPINDAAASGVAKYSTIGNIQSVLKAAQSDQATGSSTSLFVTPGVQQFHDSAAKFWLYSIVTAGTPATSASYNVTSIADTGTGIITITIATDFSSSNWCGSGLTTTTSISGYIQCLGSLAAGTVQSRTYKEAAAGFLDDSEASHVKGHGVQ